VSGEWSTNLHQGSYFLGGNNMPQFKEIVDSKSKIISTDASAPGYPSIEQMRKSQADGAKGIGLNKQSFNESLKDFNQAPSINGEE
jgi:hypothetical protein